MLSAKESGLQVEKQVTHWKRTPQDVELYLVRPLAAATQDSTSTSAPASTPAPIPS